MSQAPQLITRLAAAGLDLLALHAARPGRYPCLLESVADGGSGGRFDVLFAFPEDELVLDADFRLAGPNSAGSSGFLDALDKNWSAERCIPDPDAPPVFRGGWFLFLGYELLREIEPTIVVGTEPGQPVAFAVRSRAAIVRDQAKGMTWVIADPGCESCIRDIERDLAAPGWENGLRLSPPAGLLAGELGEPDPERFLEAVALAREYIAAGDVFQANLSRRWTGRLRDEVLPWHIYASLRRTNPAPFAGLVTRGDFAIVSSSPERLVRTGQGLVETRPIAGTRPRPERFSRVEEEERRRELLASDKERAEHVMLIDLERNDLGRVCVPGTVQVSEFMTLESYAHVHHIVSNVTGKLRPEVSPGDLIRAVFPGGTITGCPKVRCMEIIQQLEGSPRGPYTGSLGYLNRDGSCDLNILIRTIVASGREVTFAAGSGIVADSDPLRELEETRAKAKGMVLALAG